MRYSAQCIDMTTGKEKTVASNDGLTVHIREGNAPRLRITVRDDTKGQVFYTTHTFNFGKWHQVSEIITYYNVSK